jgi:hypothetical protein
MTTFTSNRNEFSGKVHSAKQSWQDKNDFSERSGCAGYALVIALVIVAVVLFTVVLPALQ